ncbi:MAG: hypothetical protein WA081_07870 [Desulfosalsimonadaceae bacterium]
MEAGFTPMAPIVWGQLMAILRRMNRKKIVWVMNQILDIRKNLFIIFSYYGWAFIWFKGRFLYEGVTIAKVVA